jgi:uncharacterized protein YfaS (alpha-2-macroglobulin family)
LWERAVGWASKRAVAIVAALALGLGFGGGFLTARSFTSGHATPGAAPAFVWPFFGKPRAADAPRGGPRKPDGFAVWKTRIDTQGADPVSCVTLSRPLDARKSYSDFVLVSPDLGHPVAVSVHDDELCVAGLGFAGHKLTLLKGLPARTGETLADNVDVDFAGADQPPYVGFDGGGVILPREESDGVGIDTLNVSRLHIEVSRVADRNLVRKSITAPDPTPEGEYSYDGDEADDARLVWKGDVAVAAPDGQRAVTVFPLGAVLKEMKPGAYVITARDASGVLGGKARSDDDRPARARRWILFTDMGLTAYDGADALDVVARSLQTAKPLAGVRLALVAKDGEELASTRSDADGHARFDHALLDGEGAAKAVMVMAYGPKADFTLLDLNRAPIDLSSQLKGEAGRTPAGVKAQTGRAAAAAVDAYLYADRGVYRPGETVHLVGLMRDRLSHAVKDRKGALIVRRPSGTEYQRIRFDGTPSGALAQDITLPATAPLGRWKVELRMDGADDPSGQASFAVEDFAPQRLAVEVSGDAGRPLAAGESRKIQVAARFLYGAPGAGLQAQTQARIAPDADPFPQFKGFRWGDEQTPFEAKLVQLPQTVTDATGAARLTLGTAQAADAVQPLSAEVTASVLEPGGRPVSETMTLKLRPRALYLGVSADSGGGDGDRVRTFDVIAVDAQGRRIAAEHVGYTLIAENWTYDWFEQDGRWGFHRTSHDSPIAKGVLAVSAAQPARISRRLPWGDYRLVLEDAATGAKTVIRQSAGWDEAAKDEDTPDSARLTVADKAYAPGDTVELHIQAPFAGEAEVAVASDRVISLRTVSVPKGGGIIRLPTSAAWGGGAYLLVSVMQPRDPATAPKPRRALGVVYVPLKPRGQVLSVSLSAPAKLDSRAPIVVPLQVKGLAFGARAHVTLAAVDEGILRLTHQASPNPVKWYFGRHALSVDYRDDYGRLLDPNLGAPAAVDYGGDEVGGAGLTATPIKTVALWSGVVDTDAAGRATVRLPAGAYNGQLRLMAVAWNDQAVGSGEEPVLTREPVVAELDLPRFLAPGDRADIGLELHNVEGRVGAYVAQITGEGGLLAAFRNVYALVLGQRVLDHVSLTAPVRPGVGAVTLRVSGPGFATATRYPLQTRFGWDAVTRATLALQKPGEAYTPSPDLLRGLAAGDVSLTVSYSPFRGFDPAPIAEALSRYPYGCTEQLVSTAYPLLYAQEVSADPRLRRTPGALVNTVVQILDREGLDGAFGLWRPGDAEADAWLGAYTVDFLLEARARGVPVPDDAMQRALHGMRLISRPDDQPSIDYRLTYEKFWGKGLTKRMRSRAAAYALYDLAKAGQGDLARLRWYHDIQFAAEPSPLARAQVGAGLARMGDRARAHDSLIQAVHALGYREEADWYQSPLRDLAGVISLAYEAGESDLARSLQAQLENRVKSPDDLNTQEQARLLAAAHAMLAAAGPVRITASGANPLSAQRWSVGRLADARFVNAGAGALWRTATVHGLPLSAPGADAHGLTLRKAYFSLDGRPVDPSHLTQGQRVVVRLSGDSGQARTILAVVADPLPAGFEIESTLAPGDADAAADDNTPNAAKTKGPYAFLGALSKASVQEERDDRYVAALTLPGNKGFVLAYVARAVTPGSYFLPGAQAADMYRPSVAAHTGSGHVDIAPVK